MHKNIVFLSTTGDFYIRMSKLPYKKDDFQLKLMNSRVKFFFKKNYFGQLHICK